MSLPWISKVSISQKFAFPIISDILFFLKPLNLVKNYKENNSKDCCKGCMNFILNLVAYLKKSLPYREAMTISQILPLLKICFV